MIKYFLIFLSFNALATEQQSIISGRGRVAGFANIYGGTRVLVPPPVLSGVITNLNYTFDTDTTALDANSAVLRMTNTISFSVGLLQEADSGGDVLATNVAGFLGNGALMLGTDDVNGITYNSQASPISNWTNGCAMRYWIKTTNAAFLDLIVSDSVLFSTYIDTDVNRFGTERFTAQIRRESSPSPDASISPYDVFLNDGDWHRVIAIMNTNSYAAVQVDTNAWSVIYTNFPLAKWMTPYVQMSHNQAAAKIFIDQLTIWAGNFTTNDPVWAYDWNNGIGRTNTYTQ